MAVLALGLGVVLGANVAMAANDACFACHGNQATAPSQTIDGKTVSLWVNPTAYAAGKHGAQECTACHGSIDEAHDQTKRTYGGWARFSASASTATTATWNFWKVSGDKCTACHVGAAVGFAASDHATGWNMAHRPDGAPRTVVNIVGTDGKTYATDENYTEANCGRCHMGNNCAPCHWKTAIINNPKNTPTFGIASILDLWTSYDATATAIKSALCENAIDWTQNIDTHDFRTKTDLTSSNTVCAACHGGYKSKADASAPAIGVFGVGMSRHGQLEEMQRSGARGVHETLQLCTDCHKTIHAVKSPESMLQWRQNPDVTCVSCHPTRKITGTGVPHKNVTCLACHADGVDAILDPDGGGPGVPLVIPRVVKHLVVQGWASHDVRRDADCSRCHVEGGNQTGAPAMSTIIPVNPHVLVGLTVLPIEGPNRFATAIAASVKAFTSSEYVIIATGMNWPDALGGSALAGALDAPILLTRQDVLPQEVRDEIVRLGATKAIVLGGTPAVSDAVFNQIDAIAGVSVERISGPNRYDTANAVAARTIQVMGDAWDGTAFIATGLNFPDALGASPLAAAKGWPIYLANPALGSNAALVALMKTAGVSDAILLGGANVVADSIATELGATFETRLSGPNRYDTALAVATYGVANAGLSWNRLAIATGENFPDALAGGVLQGLDGSVLLLTPTNSLHANVAAKLTANKASITEVRFLGSTAAVSAAVRTAALNALQ